MAGMAPPDETTFITQQKRNALSAVNHPIPTIPSFALYCSWQPVYTFFCNPDALDVLIASDSHDGSAHERHALPVD